MIARILAILGLLVLFTSAALGAPPPMPGPSTLRFAPSADEFIERLSSLTPADPRAYFELGELFAGIPDPTPEQRQLARTLFVLALELNTSPSAPAPPAPGTSSALQPRADRRQIFHPPQPPLGPSVCLALASIAETSGERRWLRALAVSITTDDAAGDPTLPQPPAASPGDDIQALQLASAIGLIRAGEGRRAARLLARPEVARLLDQSESLLSPGGERGGADRLRRLMNDRPVCPECRNRRFTKGRDGVHLCPICHGHPGPPISRIELLYQLRLESVLLAGVQRTWAGQILTDDGAPLRDPDPAELAATYRVDPSKPFWHSGSWHESPAPASPIDKPPLATQPE